MDNESLIQSMTVSGQGGSLPGARINLENLFPPVPTEVGLTLEHLEHIQPHLASIMGSVQRIQQYELESIANQLRVARMPEPTPFQNIGAFFHQNYARQYRAEQRTVSESASISRGYAKSLGRNIDDTPDSQIHGKNYGDTSQDLVRTVQDIIVKTIAYSQSLTSLRIPEIEAQAKGISQIIAAANILTSANKRT